MEQHFYVSLIGFSAIFMNVLQRSRELYQLWVDKVFKKSTLCIMYLENFSYILYLSYGLFSIDVIYTISNVLNFIYNTLFLTILFYYYRLDIETKSVSIPSGVESEDKNYPPNSLV
jgi:hypothetical protein